MDKKVHINGLGLDVRSQNALLRNGKNYLEDVINFSIEDFMNMRNVGEKSAIEIYNKIQEFLSENESFDQTKISHYDPLVHEISDYLFNSPTKSFYKNFPLELLNLSDSLAEKLEKSNISNLHDIFVPVRQRGPIEDVNLVWQLVSELKKRNRTDTKFELETIKSPEFATYRNKILVDLLNYFTDIDGVRLIICLEKRLFEFICENKQGWKQRCFYASKQGFNFFSSNFILEQLEKKILSILDEFPLGISDEDLPELFPEWVPTLSVKKAIQLSEESGLTRVDKYELRIIARSRLNDFIDTLPVARNKRIFRSKIQGHTLEEIGKELSITRERVRQVLAQIKDRLMPLEEDRFLRVYEKYKLEEREFSEIFSLDSEAYGYLKEMVKNKGKLTLEDLILDDEIPEPYKNNARKVINRNAILIGKEVIRKKRPDLLDYLLRTNLHKTFTYREFFEIYNSFLEEHNLIDNQELIISERNLEAHLSRRVNVLTTQGRRFFIIDYEGTDYTELIETINLDSYDDVEISTLKFFNDYPELMKKYFLKDHYMLHNLLKSIYSGLENSKIQFGRMPMIQIGEINSFNQTLELIRQNSPISQEELAKLYKNEYGVDERTFISNVLKDFANYYKNGFYDSEVKQFSEEHKSFFEEIFTDELYDLDQVKRSFEEAFDVSADDYFTKSSFYKVGFTLVGKVLFRNTFNSLQNYVYSKVNKTGILTESDFPQWFIKQITYKNCIELLKRNGYIVEFLSKQYISKERLFQNGIGSEEIDDFLQAVFEWDTGGVYFTISSLENTGFSSSFADFGFDNKFYESLLVYDRKRRFSFFNMANSKVFCKTEDNAVRSEFLADVVNRKGNMEIDKFCLFFKNFYGISFNRTKVLQWIKDTDLYYDDIYETIYSSYDAYIEGDVI